MLYGATDKQGTVWPRCNYLLSTAIVKTNPVETRLDPDARPVAGHPRHHAFIIWKDIEKELKQPQDRDVIKPVCKATQWVSQYANLMEVCVSCVDYRQLNKSIIHE